MVKADAYGLGVARVVEELESLHPLGFGVASAGEAAELRRLGVSRTVLVFSPLPPGEYGTVVRNDAIPCLSDLEAVRLLGETARQLRRPASFHVEVDTGMGRAGFPWRRASAWAPEVAALAGAEATWTGVFTHFHSADEEGGSSLAIQWARFQEAVAAVSSVRPGLLVHACNSAATLRSVAYVARAVRPGIFLYGGVAGEAIPAPEPVVSLRARIGLVQEVEEGATVGYGATYAARGRERWATVAIGYGDGLPRLLGNRGSALVRGRRAPIVGRISMDVTVVNITDVEGVSPGDVATFIGRDGSEEIPLEEVAALASTINYEILTGLAGRLPRVWVNVGGE